VVEMEKELVTITKEEYDYLLWFYSNADFGPVDEDVRDILNSEYISEGGSIPREYLYE
jgi:hypothetical protein